MGLYKNNNGTLELIAGAGSRINDSTASATTTYSSSKIEDLLATKSYTLTKQGTYINGTKFNARRNGKFIAVDIDGDTGSNIPPNQIVTVAKIADNSSILTELQITIDNLTRYARAFIDGKNLQVFIGGTGNYTGNIFIGGTFLLA